MILIVLYHKPYKQVTLKPLKMKEQAGANILIKGHKCYRCGHEWKPDNIDQIPKVCPKCKNPYWDRPRQKD